jgi:hypothetical protein
MLVIQKHKKSPFKSLLLSCLLILLLSGCQKQVEYHSPLSQSEEDSLKYRLIRYVAKKPKKASHQSKFSPEFDDYYREQAFQNFRLEAYQKGEKDTLFLLLSRPAPSLYEKCVGVGIKCKFEGEKLSYYQEVFRTWKMKPEVLKTRATLLFEKMCLGQDLSPYYPQNSKEEYIEFPDAQTYYDTNDRIWKSKSAIPFTEE